MKSAWLILCVAFVGVGCSDEMTSTPLTDAGSDAGSTDLGSVDLGTRDLGGNVDLGDEPSVIEVTCDGLAPGDRVDVSVADGFVSDNVVIDVGDTVLFHNMDSFEHTVTSTASSDGAPVSNGIFDFDLGAEGDLCVRFLGEGTYPYFCEFHTSMRGTILVGSF